MSRADDEAPFSFFFVLGDSLSDSGAINALVVPGDPDSYLGEFDYGNARFDRQDADGDGEDDSASYAVDAVRAFGLAEEVENLAIAGAEALRSRTLETILKETRGLPGGPTLYETLAQSDTYQLPPQQNLETVIDAEAQRERIMARYAELGQPENAAGLINIGSNDFGALTMRFAEEIRDSPTQEELAIIEAAIGETIARLTGTVVQSAASFAGAGLETIVVANLFTSFTPLVQLNPVLAPIADAAIEAQNAALTAALGQLEALVSADIEIVDFKVLFEQIFDDPSSFNLLSLVEPVYLSLPFGTPGAPGEFTILENPNFPEGVADDQTLFWDIVHPTAAAHDIMAAFLSASLQDDLSFLSDDADIYLEHPFGQLDDVVFGGGGSDSIGAGAGDDVLFGGTDHDRISGGTGDDLLVGGSGDDVLLGGGLLAHFGFKAGHSDFDVLAGGDGNDQLWGGRKADFLSDGLGSDVVRGQGGHDVLVHVDEPLLGGAADARDVDVFDGGWGEDTLLLFIADREARADASRAVTNAAEGGRLSNFEIEALDLAVMNIERVVIFDERRLPRDLDLPDPLAENVAEADMWNAIPLSADGPLSIAADAVHDSDTFFLA